MISHFASGLSILCVLAPLGGCSDVPTLDSPRPVPAVLTPEARAGVAPALDLDAAAAFFRTMPPKDADRLLSDMGFPAGEPPAETRRVVVPVSSSDPAVQARVDRMMRPYWKKLHADGARPGTAKPARP
jgi:hypothetical protein